MHEIIGYHLLQLNNKKIPDEKGVECVVPVTRYRGLCYVSSLPLDMLTTFCSLISLLSTKPPNKYGEIAASSFSLTAGQEPYELLST